MGKDWPLSHVSKGTISTIIRTTPRETFINITQTTWNRSQASPDGRMTSKADVSNDGTLQEQNGTTEEEIGIPFQPDRNNRVLTEDVRRQNELCLLSILAWKCTIVLRNIPSTFFEVKMMNSSTSFFVNHRMVHHQTRLAQVRRMTAIFKTNISWSKVKNVSLHWNVVAIYSLRHPPTTPTNGSLDCERLDLLCGAVFCWWSPWWGGILEGREYFLKYFMHSVWSHGSPGTGRMRSSWTWMKLMTYSHALTIAGLA